MEEPSEAQNEPAPGSPTKEERTYALAAHLGAMVVSLLTGGMLAFVVPLVIFLSKRDESEFIADQAKEALNFRITLFIVYLVGIVTLFIGVGFCILMVIWIVDLVFGLIAAIKSYDGVRYRYPVAIRLVN